MERGRGHWERGPRLSDADRTFLTHRDLGTAKSNREQNGSERRRLSGFCTVKAIGVPSMLRVLVWSGDCLARRRQLGGGSRARVSEPARCPSCARQGRRTVMGSEVVSDGAGAVGGQRQLGHLQNPGIRDRHDASIMGFVFTPSR